MLSGQELLILILAGLLAIVTISQCTKEVVVVVNGEESVMNNSNDVIEQEEIVYNSPYRDIYQSPYQGVYLSPYNMPERALFGRHIINAGIPNYRDAWRHHLGQVGRVFRR